MRPLSEKSGLIEGSPKSFQILLERREVKLSDLIKVGLTMPALRGAAFAKIGFRMIGKPFAAREGTGWLAVKVKSSFGGISTLLLEGDGVSGILRLKR